MSDKKPDDQDPPAEGAEGAEVGDESKKKSKLKMILLILVPVLLLGGGGMGAYFMGFLDGVLGKKAESGDHGEAGGEHGAANEGEHAAVDEHGNPIKGGSTVFVKVGDAKGQDLVVNLNTADGQTRFLQLGVQLELASAADEGKVKAVMPRVVDQFQTYLRELRLKDLRGSAGIYRLQMELLARVNEAAAPVQVKDVLFEKILIQ
jgi:flagellar protein FliL